MLPLLNVAVLTEYRTHEMASPSERTLRNALKFGTTGEVNSKEGVVLIKGWELAAPNCSEVMTPQVELDCAVGEALIQQPPLQFPRTKLLFDVRIDDPFLY